MSILGSIVDKNNRMIIPCSGKMFRSTLEGKNQALAYCLNKGYLDFADLADLLSVLDYLKSSDSFVLVGSIEKVLSDDKLTYRQRIFFKSLNKLIEVCKRNGIVIEVSRDFRININNVLNCLDELVYLERYARQFSQDIDTYLTNTCLVRLNNIFKQGSVKYELNRDIDDLLIDKYGYLDRAPFVISDYNIASNTSGIFLEAYVDDMRLYSGKVNVNNSIVFGYTTNNVQEDIEKRCFS